MNLYLADVQIYFLSRAGIEVEEEVASEWLMAFIKRSQCVKASETNYHKVQVFIWKGTL